MKKYKDSAKLTNDIKFKTLDDVEIIYNKGTQIIIEKEVEKNLFLVTDTNPNSKQRNYFKVNNKEINIDYPDITNNIVIPLLLNEGWEEKDLIKHI